MTGPGTNTYLVGGTEPVVIDPGPADATHAAAIVAAAAPLGPVRAILVTHTDTDHAPGAAALAAAAGARVVGFGPAEDFAPDELVGEGWTLACPGTTATGALSLRVHGSTVDGRRSPVARYSLWAHLRALGQEGRAVPADAASGAESSIGTRWGVV